MSGDYDEVAVCQALSGGRYSACDVSDVLAQLKVPQAGLLPDIAPIPMPRTQLSTPMVAPISTILFVSNFGPLDGDPQDSNIPAGMHFTDMPAAGSITLIQQPRGLITGVLGDIMATRLQKRGIRAAVVDGRVRDIGPIGDICATRTVAAADGGSAFFTVWSKGTSTVGPALQCKAWSANVPLTVGALVVEPRDLLFVDETERGVVVIPRHLAEEVAKMLPAFKDKDDLRVADVEAGKSVLEMMKQYP